jgi:hypothetical protein
MRIEWGHTEWYPVPVLGKDCGVKEGTLEIPDELIKEYQRVYREFLKLRTKVLYYTDIQRHPWDCKCERCV